MPVELQKIAPLRREDLLPRPGLAPGYRAPVRPDPGPDKRPGAGFGAGSEPRLRPGWWLAAMLAGAGLWGLILGAIHLALR